VPKENVVLVPPGRDRASDIRELYEIIPDEVLGSGQFGIVYGGEQLHSYLPFFFLLVFFSDIQT
jgi:hypothetical protein